MVSWDTMTATERLEALITKWRIEDEEKVNFASKLIKENIDLGRVVSE
jgi:BioD-like phosphotransacetylase family protein